MLFRLLFHIWSLIMDGVALIATSRDCCQLLCNMLFHRCEVSFTVFPLIHSVANELEAIADPQPNVLNLASIIFPFLSTSTCKSFNDVSSVLYHILVLITLKRTQLDNGLI